MGEYLNLEEAVDYLIDETPEGAPFRERKVFVRGDYISVVDPNHPLHRQVRSVIGTGRTSDGKATVRLRGNTVANPNHPLLNNTDGGTTVFVVDARDTVVLADCCRRWHGKLQQYIDDWTRRRRFALPLIVCACADGAWKARGQRPGSAEWEHILNTDFNGSEINEATGDLMSTPGPTSSRPESEVAIWTNLMFSVPGGADEGKVAELPDTITGGVKVPPDWLEQIKTWFVEKYVPAHADDSPHPNRNDSYTAARKRFPGWRIKRDATWREDIWGNHAPAKWKKRGPR